MKRRWKMVTVAGNVAILVASLSEVALAAGPSWKTADDAGVGSTQARGFQSGCGIAGTTAGVLSEGALNDYEEKTLLFMLEEEKLAMDVYNALYAEWQSLSSATSPHRRVATWPAWRDSSTGTVSPIRGR